MASHFKTEGSITPQDAAGHTLQPLNPKRTGTVNGHDGPAVTLKAEQKQQEHLHLQTLLDTRSLGRGQGEGEAYHVEVCQIYKAKQ